MIVRVYLWVSAQCLKLRWVWDPDSKLYAMSLRDGSGCAARAPQVAHPLPAVIRHLEPVLGVSANFHTGRKDRDSAPSPASPRSFTPPRAVLPSLTMSSNLRTLCLPHFLSVLSHASPGLVQFPLSCYTPAAVRRGTAGESSYVVRVTTSL